MNILVVDIGTSSMRGILFTQQGERLAAEQVKYEPVKYPDGRIEQSPESWTGSLETIAAGIAKKAWEKHFSIDTVAVTSQRSAIIPVDASGQPLMDTIMWQDRRNAGICRELEPYNDLIFEKSGAKINTVFSGSRMTWIKRNRPSGGRPGHHLRRRPAVCRYRPGSISGGNAFSCGGHGRFSCDGIG